jgi:hypothetical protein
VLHQLASAPPSTQTKDVMVRQQMVQATYDAAARAQLLTLARQRRIERPHAALVLAAQARREAIDRSAEDAIDHWRQAVEHTIHDGRTGDAAACVRRNPAWARCSRRA